MSYKKKAQAKRAKALPARYRTECSACDKYALCQEHEGAWLCSECMPKGLKR